LPKNPVNKHSKPFIEVELKGEVKTYAPEEISSMILGNMKDNAEAYLGYKVTEAVVTVPTHFSAFQRQAIGDAGTNAKLKILRILNETSAAAIAYGINKNIEEAVYDVLIFYRKQS
jgi:molecular chaperone DnaK (HSP70)